MITKIFISGFPLATDELALAQLVGPHGTIVTLKMVRNKVTRKSKGYGFIEMESRKDADRVIDALDGQVMGDRELTVRIRVEEAVNPPPRFEKIKPDPIPARRKRPRI
ncbi:MAG: RNA-binding protein [Mucilaginibacter sp.]|nr:RNA-binding protein [Mucilaginibacter sp.]